MIRRAAPLTRLIGAAAELARDGEDAEVIVAQLRATFPAASARDLWTAADTAIARRVQGELEAA